MFKNKIKNKIDLCQLDFRVAFDELIMNRKFTDDNKDYRVVRFIYNYRIEQLNKLYYPNNTIC